MFKQVYESFTPAQLRQEYREEGIKYCKEGLRIYSESGKLNYILGMFYSRWSTPDDKAAREAFLKAVELDPSNSDAYLALSKLYYKHENFTKARSYAEKALKADARNESAKLWLNKIEEKRQK
jgi:tetratricopeptide (TPR) repeat protein